MLRDSAHNSHHTSPFPAFVSDYITIHGLGRFHELLKNSGTVEGADLFGEELSHFYSENNIEYIPSNVLYTFGGHSYDYIAKCRYAAFFIENDWYDENYERNPLTYKNFLQLWNECTHASANPHSSSI